MGINQETRELIKSRRKIINSLRRNKNNHGLKKRLKDINIDIKKGLQKGKDKNWEYIKNQVGSKGTTKKSWRTIKKILNKNEKTKNIEYLTNDNQEKIYSKQVIADTFMNRQKSIFTPNKSNNPRDDYIRTHWYNNHQFDKQSKQGAYDQILSIKSKPTHYQSNDQITTEEVKQALKKLKNNKAPGIYGIQNKLLKNITEELTPVLVEVFNDCLNTSYFPEKLKIAKFIMIPKKKNTKKINEHRPISLLPTLGKILEQILSQKINTWAETNKKIYIEQSGFRKNRCTTDHLFQFVQDYQQCKNKKERMHAVFIDFEKAFDKINHTYLIKKLKDLEIPTDLLNIIHNYLQNRKGFIHYKKFNSQLFDILAGVPQGSCLSPILFGLFVSDIPKPQNDVKLAQFADDIVAWLVFLSQWNKDLEKYVNKIVNWCLNWGLKVNLEKTKHMNMGKSKREVFVNGTKLSNTKEMKFLGLTIDKKCTLKKHIEEINKSYHLIKFLGVLKHNYDIPVKENLSLYKTLIRSKLEYGHIALLSSADCHLHKIEKLQNRAMRTILGRPSSTPIKDMLQEANINTIKTRLEKLAKSWYIKALENEHHPLQINLNKYHYNPLSDKHETIYNKLLNM